MSSEAEEVSDASSAEYDGYSTDTEERIWAVPRCTYLNFDGQQEKCGLYRYTCSGCPMQFSLVEARDQMAEIVDHVRGAHLTYMAYRCHATPVSNSRCSDHALHPDLMGTVLTDRLLQQHKKSAEILRRQVSQSRYLFSFLEVTTVDQKLFVCSNCPFTSPSMADYKQHVAVQHVRVVLFKGGMIVQEPCLAVLGPPHDLS
jgi:hypothetical protein